jgi:hypothetical protein
MATTTAVKPPVIRGSVPADYCGPLYYRVHVFVVEDIKPLDQMITFDDKKIAERIIHTNSHQAAVRKAPLLLDANGELVPELRTPAKARLRSTARKNWDEFGRFVSPRIRDIIEAAAPGIHIFVPIDVDDRNGGAFRVYAFFPGIATSRKRPALAFEACGIPYTMNEYGEPIFIMPDWFVRGEDRFAYLDGSVVGGAPLIFDPIVYPIYSHELVQQLGDCLGKGRAFIPMGVA